MKYFIGIVPPDDISQAIINIQNQFGNNRLEPHITIQPPVAVLDFDNWTSAIEKVANAFPPFKIELTGTGYFGQRVLFIKLQSPELTALQHQLVKAIKPFEDPATVDNRPYHPHLTLGRTWCGFTMEHFKEMELLTNNYLLSTLMFFEPTFIRVYHKPNALKGYETFKDIYLKHSL